MKGIILAGGSGTRLYPVTLGVSKQLLPVYDKPMIYYPLGVLMLAGIRDILVISTPRDLPLFQHLLGDGSAYGINLSYAEQPSPNGLAEAFIIGEDFIGQDEVCLVLGDNIFFGHSLQQNLQTCVSQLQGATVFAYHVDDPHRYGVVCFDANRSKVTSLVEKPSKPQSNWAVTGLYFYDNDVISIAKNLKPSPRGELEITDVNLAYLQRGQLQVRRLSRGFVWLDAGTHTALHEASSYIETIERRQGIKIGCPEEAALVRKFITPEQLQALVTHMPNCAYRDYLQDVVTEWHRFRKA